MEILTKHPAELLILIFLIVTFLQSGLDKLLDWSGNVSFIKDHFKNSPLKSSVPALVAIILITEVIASCLMLVGIFQIVSRGVMTYALYGMELAALTLILLLIGQRLAKDYAGAMSLAVYFIITILGIFLATS